MNIIPVKNKIYFKVEKPTAGGLDLSSKPTSTEIGEVIAVGEGVTIVAPGDIIFIKGWAQDPIQYKGEWYYFVDADTKGILAIVRE